MYAEWVAVVMQSGGDGGVRVWSTCRSAAIGTAATQDEAVHTAFMASRVAECQLVGSLHGSL